jgi:LAO/AO transport system kinase
VVQLLEAAGYDPVLIETVGIGQTGFDVLALATTTVVMFSPESGDSVQMLKAGLLEAGDIFVVNKADRPGADAMLSEIRLALELLRDAASENDQSGAQAWSPPVLSMTATSGGGVEELALELERHHKWYCALSPLHPLRLRHTRAELIYSLRGSFALHLEGSLHSRLEECADAVAAGRMTQADAVRMLEVELAALLS